MQTVNSSNFRQKVITVCDRESDIFEFFSESERLNEYFLVRSSINRRLSGDSGMLQEFMSEQEKCGEIQIYITGNGNRKSRNATLNLSYKKIKLKVPTRNPSAIAFELKEVELYALHARESVLKKSSQEKPLDWLLLTNHPIENIEQARECCRWYTLRWKIEEYHKILKSGCNVENCRLETIERLGRYIALKSVIAFRLFWMTLVNREIPAESCTIILKESEWQALYCRNHKTNIIPSIPPSINEAIRMIASLGGFLCRKGDGEPGNTVIWRGWQKLQEMSELWDIMKSPGFQTCG